MNYCSLEDAWGKPGYITDQYKKYESKDDIVENFDQTINGNEVNYSINDNKIPENIINQNFMQKKNQNKKISQKCVFTCDDLISHLNKCSSCRMKMKKHFSFKLVGKIQNFINNNKDTILLILIALFILIFLNLLFSIFKK